MGILQDNCLTELAQDYQLLCAFEILELFVTHSEQQEEVLLRVVEKLLLEYSKSIAELLVYEVAHPQEVVDFVRCRIDQKP